MDVASPYDVIFGIAWLLAGALIAIRNDAFAGRIAELVSHPRRARRLVAALRVANVVVGTALAIGGIVLLVSTL